MHAGFHDPRLARSRMCSRRSAESCRATEREPRDLPETGGTILKTTAVTYCCPACVAGCALALGCVHMRCCAYHKSEMQPHSCNCARICCFNRNLVCKRPYTKITNYLRSVLAPLMCWDSSWDTTGGAGADRRAFDGRNDKICTIAWGPQFPGAHDACNSYLMYTQLF